MESRSMELTLISARDLNNTNILSKTKAYAVAWISNDHKNRQRTPLDKDNGTDPSWNQVMRFTLDEAALQQGRLVLEIVIYADATFGDKEIGRVSIPLKEFLRSAGGNKGATTSAQFVSYQVRKPSGKAKGILNLSVKLAEKPEVKQQQQQPQAFAGSYGAGKAEPVTAYPAGSGSYGAGKAEHVAAYPAGSYGAANAEPVTAYPAYPPPSSSSQPAPYPPPNNQYPPPPYPPQAGYPPPPPYHQGYPPPPYQGYPPNQGYPPYQGYPPVVPAAQQPPKKNNRLGMGLGAGLLGGALGGLLLGTFHNNVLTFHSNMKKLDMPYTSPSPKLVFVQQQKSGGSPSSSPSKSSSNNNLQKNVVDEGGECTTKQKRSSDQAGLSNATFKKPRTEVSAGPPMKVCKENLGERITALQQLVSPFGQNDTASVLFEAMGYIKFLQDQVQVQSLHFTSFRENFPTLVIVVRMSQENRVTTECDADSLNPLEQYYPLYQRYPPIVPVAQQPHKKNNRLGMGLGAGLLGGALGGFLLRDIIGDSYDGGFDGGDFGGSCFDGGL